MKALPCDWKEMHFILQTPLCSLGCAQIPAAQTTGATRAVLLLHGRRVQTVCGNISRMETATSPQLTVLMNHILTELTAVQHHTSASWNPCLLFFSLQKTEHAMSFTLLLATFAPQFEIFLYGNFMTADTPSPPPHLLQVHYFNWYLYR